MTVKTSAKIGVECIPPVKILTFLEIEKIFSFSGGH